MFFISEPCAVWLKCLHIVTQKFGRFTKDCFSLARCCCAARESVPRLKSPKYIDRYSAEKTVIERSAVLCVTYKPLKAY